MSAALWAGVLAGYAIAVPVGAVATYLVALAARTSLRVGIAGALGVATTDGLYALVATLGGAALAGVIAPLAEWLRVGAALVLLGVAAHTAVEGVRAYRRHAAVRPASSGPVASSTTASGAYLRLLAMTAVNPATVLYFATVVIGARATVGGGAGAGGLGGVGVGGAGLGGAGLGPVADGLFVLGAFAASASWQLLLACGGSFLGHAVSGARGRLTTALVSAGVMVLLVAMMLLG